MQIGIWQVLIVAVIVLLLFGGRGKLSSLMGDAAKGIRAFRDGLKGEDDAKTAERDSAALPRDVEKDEAKR